LGLWYQFFNFTSLFVLEIIDGVGGLMIGSGKSGFLARHFKKFSQEVSAFDTMFTSLGVSLGSLLGGFLLKYFQFSIVLQFFGFALLFLTLFIILLDWQNKS